MYERIGSPGHSLCMVANDEARRVSKSKWCLTQVNGVHNLHTIPWTHNIRKKGAGRRGLNVNTTRFQYVLPKWDVFPPSPYPPPTDPFVAAAVVVVRYYVHSTPCWWLVIILSSTIQIMNVNKQPAVHCIVAALFEISVLMRNISSVPRLRSKLNNNLMNSQGSFNSQGTDLCLDFRVHCRPQCDKSCLSVRDFSIIGIVIQSGS